ncbi:MAG: hypothetical protein ACYC61_14980, partial [Isosphaeraceae bacterium]
GPFGRSNPLVLIHAPLYYRIAALLAWPLAKGGLHPAEAARIAGRVLSFAGLIGTIWAAARLARLGGVPRGSGWWAAGLIASSPVLAGFPMAVRPDLLGVALQTWAVVLAAEEVQATAAGNRPGRRLVIASVLFGLAACVKQHLVIAWIIVAAWVMANSLRTRMSLDRLSQAVIPGALTAFLLDVGEWLATDGRIWGAAFVAATYVGTVHPGGWIHVATVIAAMSGKGAGLAAAAFAGVLGARGTTRNWVVGPGAALVAAIVVTAWLQLWWPGPWIAASLSIASLAGLGLAAVGWIAPARLLDTPGPIHRLLLGLLAVEVIVLIALSWTSSGAWINYGLSAMVTAAVLTARTLARVPAASSSLRRTLPALASLAILSSALMDAKVELNRRRIEQKALNDMFVALGVPRSTYFFADRPGLNRMIGRLDMVYDDWLYAAFERAREAEPRSRWLRSFLEAPSAATVVVLESDRREVDGVPVPLEALGFEPAGRYGSFRAWSRIPGRRFPDRTERSSWSRENHERD